MKYSNIKIFEENSKYLQKMISDITGIDEEILLDNVLERKNILENPAVMLYKKRLNPIELNNFRGK